MADFTIGNKLKVNQPSANVDSLYGPYTGATEALALVDAYAAVSIFKEKGRTLGITVNNGPVIEYWFKSAATSISDLVPKGQDLTSINNLITGETASRISGDTYLQNQITGITTNFVPYTGATTDVDLGIYNLKTNTLKLNTNPTNYTGFTEGEIFYDKTNKTFSGYIDSDITMQFGQEELVLCYNITTNTIPNGTMVYPKGANGDMPTIGLAQANTGTTYMDIGMTTQDIPSGSTGFVTNRGIVHGVNTSGFTEGQTIYLSPYVPGGITNIEPTDVLHYVVKVGVALLIHPTNGSVYIRQVLNNRLVDLIDVGVVNPQVDQILTWNGTEFINGNQRAISAGAGVAFYLDSTTIISGGTQSLGVESLSKSPSIGTQEIESVEVFSDTRILDRYIYNTPLNRTTIDGGAWVFNTFGYVANQVGGSSIPITMYKVVSGNTYTASVTGTTTSRTLTISGATTTPFLSGDTNTNITLTSFVQTPTALLRIIGFTSANQVTVETLPTYVNETGVTYSIHRFLFTDATTEINNEAVGLTTSKSIQPSFITNLTDKLAITYFGSSNKNTILYLYHGGVNYYTYFETPLAVLHNDLAGLQGGDADYKGHLTSLQNTNLNNTSGINTGDLSGHDGLVPYTGAMSNVDLGANNLIVDTTTLYVNSSTRTVSIGNSGDANTFNVGQSGSVVYSNSFESGTLTDFTTSGNQLWTINSVTKRSGTYAAKSGAIVNGQMTTLSFVYNLIAPAYLSFYIKLLTEEGYDFVSIKFNGILYKQFSGTVDWTKVIKYLSVGSNTLTITYATDVSDTPVGHAVYVDDFLIQTETAKSLFNGQVQIGNVVIPSASALYVDGDINLNGSLKMFDSSMLSISEGYVSLGFNVSTNITGPQNTIVGNNAGNSLTSGYGNMLIGYSAGKLLTTGYHNLFLGANVGNKTISSYRNVGIGAFSFDSLTSGYENTAIGYSAGYLTTTGYWNTNIGAFSGQKYTSSIGSTAVGYAALFSTQTGGSNVAVGMNAIKGVTGLSDVSNNTAIGTDAGIAIRTGGNNNIILGYRAGYTLLTGSKNIIIGYNIDLPTTSTSNTLDIGNFIYGTGLNGSGAGLSTTGKLGIGLTTPTAILHLPAGTATASTAPLKFTSGLTLTVAESGAIEFNNNRLYFTPVSARETVAFLSDLSSGLAGSTGTTNYISKWVSSTGLTSSLVYDNGTNVGIGTSVFNSTNPEKLLVDAGITTSVNVISSKGNINSYLQTNIQNLSSGTTASSDIVATNDTGSETTNFIDMGINSSGFATGSTWSINGANDGYLYTSNGNLSIGTASNKDIIFHTSGLTSSNERMRITSGGFVGIATNNPQYNLEVSGTTKLMNVTGNSITLNDSFIVNNISGDTILNVSSDVSDYILEVLDTNNNSVFSVSNDGTIKQNSVKVTGVTSGSSPHSIMLIDKTSCNGIFFDYVVHDTTYNGYRIGTVMCVHDGINLKYSETSTEDLNASTLGLNFSIIINNTNVELIANVSSSTFNVTCGVRKI